MIRLRGSAASRTAPVVRRAKRPLSARMVSFVKLALLLGLPEASAWLAVNPSTRAKFNVPRAAATKMTVAANRLALPEPPLPQSAKAPWEVHKFGGASLATAALYKECSDLLVAESERTVATAGSFAPTMAIVSAKGGVTDRLIKVVQAALNDMGEAEEILAAVAAEQVDVVRELSTPERAAAVEATIKKDQDDIIMVVRAVSLLRTIPPSTMELVTGYGEVWSAMTMHAYLDSEGIASAWLDARDVLVVEQTGFGLGEKGSSNVVGVDPLWEATAGRVKGWFGERPHLLSVDCTKAAPIVVVTGFVAATLDGTPTTLKVEAMAAASHP